MAFLNLRCFFFLFTKYIFRLVLNIMNRIIAAPRPIRSFIQFSLKKFFKVLVVASLKALIVVWLVSTSEMVS